MIKKQVSLSSLLKWLHNLFIAVVCFFAVPMWSMVTSIAIFVGLVVWAPTTIVRSVFLAYIPYILLDRTPQRGFLLWFSEETIEWFRRCPIFSWTAQHFPVSLHKTEDLDPSKRYLFLYHPHGVIGMGVNTAINTNGCSFDKVFPGIRRVGVTLNVCFFVPFFREWMLLNGLVSANRGTLERVLSHGRSIVLVPGGAAEALYTNPSQMKLLLKDRKGFIKLARETGALPIPCLGFGENRVFHVQPPSSGPFSWQMRAYKAMTFSLPLLKWPTPLKNPIHVVVGKPLVFESNDLNECHAQYCKAVQEMYDENKEKYGYADIMLEFM